VRKAPLNDFLKKLNILDPEEVDITFEEDENSLKLIVDGKLLTGLSPSKPFPITAPNFIIFKDGDGVDVCVIKDYAQLDLESRENLQILLDKMYFIPRILKIEKIETSGDEFEWKTVTDKGPREFRTRGRMSVIPMGKRLIITDVNDNVYEIENLPKLEARSKKVIESTL